MVITTMPARRSASAHALSTSHVLLVLVLHQGLLSVPCSLLQLAPTHVGMQPSPHLPQGQLLSSCLLRTRPEREGARHWLPNPRPSRAVWPGVGRLQIPTSGRHTSSHSRLHSS